MAAYLSGSFEIGTVNRIQLKGWGRLTDLY